MTELFGCPSRVPKLCTEAIFDAESLYQNTRGRYNKVLKVDYSPSRELLRVEKWRQKASDMAQK
jgi:hypothetical protein